MSSNKFNPALLINNQIARCCYAAATAWDEEHGADTAPAWADIDDETRTALFSRIETTLRDPRAGDATVHNKHVATMTSPEGGGWAAGPVYDEKRKIDPTLVQFHMLPPHLKARERMLRGVILALSQV